MKKRRQPSYCPLKPKVKQLLHSYVWDEGVATTGHNSPHRQQGKIVFSEARVSSAINGGVGRSGHIGEALYIVNVLQSKCVNEV